MNYAILFFISLQFSWKVSALICHDGYSFDGSVPLTIASGCFSCYKSVRTTKQFGIEHKVFQFGGEACSALPTIVISIDKQYLTPFPETTCSAHAVSSPQTTRATSTSFTSSTSPTTKYQATTPGCQRSTTVDICQSDGLDTLAAYCICCGDKCNGNGLKCGGQTSIASFVPLFILIWIGNFLINFLNN